ncbi:MAG: hypothetical protein D6744_14960 [Planctomycetota bacterium]|nr:MAG: hypothetical protein D6744_14960 [Planctomycetota bacterium]
MSRRTKRAPNAPPWIGALVVISANSQKPRNSARRMRVGRVTRGTAKRAVVRLIGLLRDREPGSPG